MRTWLLSVLLVLGFAGSASAQVYDLWLFDGVGPAPTAVTPKGVGNLSSATVVATATTTNAGYIYRQTDWSNKWTNATNVVNTAMTFSSAGGPGSPDGRFSVTLDKYYTFNVPTVPVFGDNVTEFAILETAGSPTAISSLTRNFPTPTPSNMVEITVTLAASPGVDELVYVIYSTDAWSTYTAAAVFMEGNVGFANIPAQTLGTTVSYYAMTSPVASASWGTSKDVLTLRLNNNGGLNYSYTVSAGPDETNPTDVSDLSATADENLNKIVLTWSPVTEANFETYEIYYNTTGEVSTSDTKIDKTTLPSLGSIATSTATISGLNWGTTYFFTIRGVDVSANAGTLSNEVSASTIAEPIVLMDGTFDGEGKWGSPVATADQVAGWFDVNAKKLYITYDATYVYFAVEVTYSSWQKWVFLINTIPGAGGSVTAANDATTYGHAQLPDFAIVQNGVNATLKVWNGSAWEDHATSLTAGVWTGFSTSYVEVRILKSMLNDVSPGDVQFYITGNNAGEHSSFDSVPDDLVMTSWNNPLTLSNYATSVTLPVELASFTGKMVNGNVLLSWSTASEKNNYGFEVEKNLGNGWNKVGFVAGNGTTTEAKSYSFSDSKVSDKATYRLKQLDLDGTTSYSASIEVFSGVAESFELKGNYPNPFNPSTVIEFSLPSAGTVDFAVFNTLGQLVSSSKVNGISGLNQLSFKADGLSSGVYFYQLTFNGKSVTKTMSFLK
ncbi:MAG: T9SS type A sorting domain-containing protein [Bacteroidetes bacterium]|nr:T9SS type A sorting domain-containing protein [Bacteroidota bacterium]